MRTISPPGPAREFFNNLVTETEYGIVVSNDVNTQISVTLPGVTIDEAMETIGEIYGLDITRRRNIYYVQTGGLRTRQFTINYLDIRRSGSSNSQISGANANQ
ncbi:MAG: hypothetical protein WD180_12620 [Pseudohongiellaceae bacterium]